ncbi:hypothetical protein F0562_019565 [Nyssa sinensis]|uniref:Cytochrome b5 heme-binding domain-containing protein n=1 Tax=Nyssa sinensis TaxID=561372 RepID=A0A5J5BTY3_9ASTE|nr:hypothetical protein F0562_019565 [Nyssa sinensis]
MPYHISAILWVPVKTQEWLTIRRSLSTVSVSEPTVVIPNPAWVVGPATRVYDVTSYVEEHPGGDAILAHSGDDSTEGFFGP